MIKNSQRQKEKRKAAKWLQTLIGDDWGIRVLPRNADKPRPVHANSNERVERCFPVVPGRKSRKSADSTE